MSETSISDARRRVLDHVKRHGPTTTSGIADALSLTDVAVRQHLLGLEFAGLVSQSRRSPAGRGRPAVNWTVAEGADEVYPNRHAELTVGLIDAVRKTFGQAGLAQIVDARSADQIRQYRKLMPPSGSSLRQRVEGLARIRTDEGYMAEVVREGRSAYLLIEHHCPICDAARCCTGLCDGELAVFRRVLGAGVAVERVAHLLSGEDRCVYRIERASPRK